MSHICKNQNFISILPLVAKKKLKTTSAFQSQLISQRLLVNIVCNILNRSNIKRKTIVDWPNPVEYAEEK